MIRIKKLMSSGMTIVELVNGMAVIGVIITAVASIIAVCLTTLQTIDVRKDLVMNGYYGSSKFVREFREIDTQAGILTANPTTARFVVADTLTVEYNLTGSDLTRLIIGNPSSSVMVSQVDVANSSFSFWDSTQTQLTGVFLPSNVWRARLKLTMSDGNISVVFASDVFPEDFK